MVSCFRLRDKLTMEVFMKMKFAGDTFYKGEIIFQSGLVYDVDTEKGWADKWLKRGGEAVKEGAIVGKSSMDIPVEVKPVAKKPVASQTRNGNGKKGSQEDQPPVPSQTDESKTDDKSKEP